jgi:STE24 endopeptidase
MTPLDAATSAWLAKIAPSEQLAAAAATDRALWSWALGWAVVALTCILAARSGALARLRGAVEAERPRPWAAGAVVSAAFAAMLLAASAPIALMQGAAPAGLSASDLTALLASTTAASVLLAITRARPKTWPAWCGLAAAGALFAWAWLPYALGDGAGSDPPAPPGPTTAALAQLIAETGVPAGQVRLSPASGFDADVAGGFGRAYVSVSRQALAAPPSQVKAYVAHIMGHYANNDVLTLALVMALLALCGAGAVALAFRPLARLVGAKGVEHPSDPAGLPVAALILAGVIVLGTPVLAAVGRAVNVRADQYSLEHAREPDGLAAVLIRDWDHRAIAPGPLQEALFYTHPPLAERVRHAMAWKQSR